MAWFIFLDNQGELWTYKYKLTLINTLL